jgi:hypothetical protein
MMRRLGQILTIVTQLVVVLAPIAEGHADRVLSGHMEAPRNTPHPGQHDEKLCPACVLLSMHGRVEHRTEFPSIVRRVAAAAPQAVVGTVSQGSRHSNSSRAPPLAV